MSEWQPIETAPTDTPILVYQPGVVLSAGEMSRYSKTSPLHFYPSFVDGRDWECDLDTPSHWMPLPPPPTPAAPQSPAE